MFYLYPFERVDGSQETYRRGNVDNMVDGHGVRALPNIVNQVSDYANCLIPDQLVVSL